MSNTHQKDKSLVELQRSQVWGQFEYEREGIPCSRTTDVEGVVILHDTVGLQD